MAAAAPEAVFLAIMRAARSELDAFDALFAAHGLTNAQYNVLRILRGAGPEGLCRNEVRDRLLTRMPDVTRLLDRMEEAGWIRRERREDDRRQVETHLTRTGRTLVDSLDAAVTATHARLAGHLRPRDRRALVTLLARIGGQPRS